MFPSSFPLSSFLPLFLHAMFILMIAPLALALLLHTCRARRLVCSRAISLVLISLISATAGAIGLTVARHSSSAFSIVATALQAVLEFLLTAIALFVLRRFALTSVAATRSSKLFMPVLNAAALLIVCELVSSLVPPSPVFLWSAAAFISRVVSLFAIALVIHASFFTSRQVPLDIEKEPIQTVSPKMPARVSSPTPGTWPFPASLAHSQVQTSTSASARDVVSASRLVSSPTAGGVSVQVINRSKTSALLVPLVLGICQTAALLCAAVNIVLVVLVSHSNPSAALLSGLFISHGACVFVWAVMLLVVIYVMPFERSTSALLAEESPNKQPEQTALRSNSPIILHPTPPRMAPSDTASEFLSVPDPFASFPPPLPSPPTAPLGLGLDEVEVDVEMGWNKKQGIGAQYRFPAPRSKSFKVRGKAKSKKLHNISGKQPLEAQGSAQTLISSTSPSVPSCSTGQETDEEKERALGDEAMLAQMLLQSLSAPSQDKADAVSADDEYGMDTDAVTETTALGTPQLPLVSRWSSSTTTHSTMTSSASYSGPGLFTKRDSGVSYASSERELKEFRDRISMHTILSRTSSPVEPSSGDTRPLSSATVVS